MRTVSCYGIYVFARDPPPLQLKVGDGIKWQIGPRYSTHNALKMFPGSTVLTDPTLNEAIAL